MYTSNLQDYGHLLNGENYEITHLHNDMFSIFDNKLVSIFSGPTPNQSYSKCMWEPSFDIVRNRSLTYTQCSHPQPNLCFLCLCSLPQPNLQLCLLHAVTEGEVYHLECFVLSTVSSLGPANFPKQQISYQNYYCQLEELAYIYCQLFTIFVVLAVAALH